jgi:hypothetical protein
VIADRAYSEPLRERLKKRGIDVIVPYRENKVCFTDKCIP